MPALKARRQVDVTSEPGARQAFLALALFLLAIFVVTATDAIRFARAAHEWIVGDWLISYAVGFVRRGLVGELLRHASIWTGVPIGYWIAGAQILSYSVILAGVLALCRSIELEPWLLFFLVSPATLLFPVYSYDGGYRKEILFIAFLVVVAVQFTGPAPRGRRAASLVVAAVAPLLVLAHEGLFLYFPYLSSLMLFSGSGPARRRVTRALLPMITGAVAFVFSVWFHGDQATV